MQKLSLIIIIGIIFQIWNRTIPQPRICLLILLNTGKYGDRMSIFFLMAFYTNLFILLI